MIRLEDIYVVFDGNNGETPIHAVNGVSLEVARGEIYGIVGYSGAGKSTLVRTINRLQEPTRGRVIVNGEDLTAMNEQTLRGVRKKIGMIFQHFNLMDMQTVAENVEFPIRNSNQTRSERMRRVEELLAIVGMLDRKDAYPSQLSGGQKQRVAIARALASEPDVLLCDEATSALDPKNTRQILQLLRRLNETMGLTIVMITHEMQVVRSICTHVAVMDAGKIIERGRVVEVFVDPQKRLTKDFIDTALHIDEGVKTAIRHPEQFDLQTGDRLVLLKFRGRTTGRPVIHQLSVQHAISANILFANIEVFQEESVGTLLLSFRGTSTAIAGALDTLEKEGVGYHTFSKEEIRLIREEEKVS